MNNLLELTGFQGRVIDSLNLLFGYYGKVKLLEITPNGNGTLAVCEFVFTDDFKGAAGLPFYSIVSSLKLNGMSCYINMADKFIIKIVNYPVDI